MVEHADLIALIDEMDYNWSWGSGLCCAFIEDGHGFGFASLGEHDASTCWLVANSAFRLGATDIVWFGGAYQDSELGRRVMIYLAVNSEKATYARRPVSITDEGKVIPAGELEFVEPVGWLPRVSLDAQNPAKEWPVVEQLALLKKLGHVVEVRA